MGHACVMRARHHCVALSLVMSRRCPLIRHHAWQDEVSDVVASSEAVMALLSYLQRQALRSRALGAATAKKDERRSKVEARVKRLPTRQLRGSLVAATLGGELISATSVA